MEHFDFCLLNFILELDKVNLSVVITPFPVLSSRQLLEAVDWLLAAMAQGR